MRTPRHIEKVGVLGSIFTAACCLGISAVVSVLTAIGLGFLLNDVILAPLLVVFLGLTIWGLAAGRKRHGQPWPLLLGIFASVALIRFLFPLHSRPAAYAAVGVLVLATILNVIAGWRRRPVASLSREVT